MKSGECVEVCPECDICGCTHMRLAGLTPLPMTDHDKATPAISPDQDLVMAIHDMVTMYRDGEGSDYQRMKAALNIAIIPLIQAPLMQQLEREQFLYRTAIKSVVDENAELQTQLTDAREQIQKLTGERASYDRAIKRTSQAFKNNKSRMWVMKALKEFLAEELGK